jgi:hypothetical protein
MLVASTGLGKTVMGTHIAIQLHAEDLIHKVFAAFVWIMGGQKALTQ